MSGSLQLYTLIYVTLANALLTQEGSVSLRRTTGSQAVGTVPNGYSGESPGMAMCEIEIESAIPMAAIEYDPATVMQGLLPVEVGLVFAGWTGASYWALLGMSAATVGIYGSRASFWPMPSIFLTGTAAAGAIALINAVGNLGGYVGPFIVGWIKDSTGSFQAGLYFLAAMSFGCAVITYFAARASGEQSAIDRARTQPAE